MLKDENGNEFESEEDIRKAAEAAEDALFNSKEGRNGTYILNPIKYTKMIEAINLARDLCYKPKMLKIAPLDPTRLHGYFEIYDPASFHFLNNNIKDFRKIIDIVDYIGIYNNGDDKLIMEFSIKNLFVKIQE